MTVTAFIKKNYNNLIYQSVSVLFRVQIYGKTSYQKWLNCVIDDHRTDSIRYPTFADNKNIASSTNGYSG